MALLFHDVGKGRGKGHALIGGQIIQRIGHRLGLPPEDIETLHFLIIAHLKISHVSQRRDLDDPRVARDMAEAVGSLDRLKLLYVHSVCDLVAVSPDAMTQWTATLYENLLPRDRGRPLRRRSRRRRRRHRSQIDLPTA
jgi:[protein-PII] uridylyltransferase